MRNFLRLYKVEQKLFFRSPDVFIFLLCMPVVVLIMIGLIAGSKLAGDSGMTYLESSFVAVTSVGICCSAFMSIPITFLSVQGYGYLKRISKKLSLFVNLGIAVFLLMTILISI